MKPRSIDSLEIVEIVMVIEEFFEIEIPDDDAEEFGGPREIVDHLEQSLRNSRPNKRSIAFLKKLAKDQERPELAEGLEGTWRREQIAAIIRDVFRDHE